MSVTARYGFDPAEHYQAARAVTRLTWFRWLPWIAGGIVFIYVLVDVVLPGWGDRDALSLFIEASPYLLVGAFWIALLPWSQRRAARKLVKRDPSVRGPQERSVDALGFHSRGNGVNLDVPWHAMARAVETDRFFLFFYNKQCAYYIPKRALSDTQCDEVRTLMRGAGMEGATARVAATTGE